MTDLSGTIKELIAQRDGLNEAIAALEGISNGASRTRRRGGKRAVSAAGRARIAAAQRARWAKFRKAKKAS